MSDLKICSQCLKAKISSKDFYMHKGQSRSECKACCIQRNLINQKKAKSWKNREVDKESRRIYMRAYYEKNKEKFSEYRDKFREKYPKYYKDYFASKKEKDSAKNSLGTKLTNLNSQTKGT